MWSFKLNHEKKNMVAIFFQNVQKVQKCYGILKMTTLKFLAKSEQKTIRHKFFNYRRAQPPIPTHVLAGDFVPHPSQWPPLWMKDDYDRL